MSPLDAINIVWTERHGVLTSIIESAPDFDPCTFLRLAKKIVEIV